MQERLDTKFHFKNDHLSHCHFQLAEFFNIGKLREMEDGFDAGFGPTRPPSSGEIQLFPG